VRVQQVSEIKGCGACRGSSTRVEAISTAPSRSACNIGMDCGGFAPVRKKKQKQVHGRCGCQALWVHPWPPWHPTMPQRPAQWRDLTLMRADAKRLHLYVSSRGKGRSFAFGPVPAASRLMPATPDGILGECVCTTQQFGKHTNNEPTQPQPKR